MERKLATSAESLCEGFPSKFDLVKLVIANVQQFLVTDEFVAYFKYIKSLEFEDKPDYDFLKENFRKLFFKEGFENDSLFDWDVTSRSPAAAMSSTTSLLADATDMKETSNVRSVNVATPYGGSTDAPQLS